MFGWPNHNDGQKGLNNRSTKHLTYITPPRIILIIQYIIILMSFFTRLGLQYKI